MDYKKINLLYPYSINFLTQQSSFYRESVLGLTNSAYCKSANGKVSGIKVRGAF